MFINYLLNRFWILLSRKISFPFVSLYIETEIVTREYTRAPSRSLSRVVFLYTRAYGLALTLASQTGTVYRKKREGGKEREQDVDARQWYGPAVTTRRQSRCNNCRSWLASRVIEEITRAVDTIPPCRHPRPFFLFSRTFITRDVPGALSHTASPPSPPAPPSSWIRSAPRYPERLTAAYNKRRERTCTVTQKPVCCGSRHAHYLYQLTTKKNIMPFIVKYALFQHMRNGSIAMWHIRHGNSL